MDWKTRTLMKKFQKELINNLSKLYTQIIHIKMNLSSIVINIDINKKEQITSDLKSLCEIHLAQGSKLIATIEANSIDDEIGTVRKIEKVKGVTSVVIAFSYSEKELEKIRKDVELQQDTPEWLNDDSITAKQIKYQGDLKKKF